MPRLTTRLAFPSVGLALAGAVSLSCSPAQGVEAMPARVADLTYEIYLGGLHIFTFDVDMTLRPDRYRVTAAGGTRGVIGWLYKWDTNLTAEGFDRNGRIEPHRYVAETNWQSNQRTTQLSFMAGGRYDLQQTPPPEPDPDVEGALPDVLPEGTVDPLTFALAATRTLERSGRCDQTVPVFDGRRRFDLTVRQTGQTSLPPSGHSIYQGPAVRCSFSMKRISGFRKSGRTSRQWDAGSAAPPIIWVASIRQDLPPVPVRYEGAIALGHIVIHLTKAEVRTEPAEAPAEGQAP